MERKPYGFDIILNMRNFKEYGNNGIVQKKKAKYLNNSHKLKLALASQCFRGSLI